MSASQAPKKLFGTDGIRGRANLYPMTSTAALRVAMAAGVILKRDYGVHGHTPRVVIGKDTRISGYMLEQAMASGFLASGVDVVFLGPLPTPAVAMHTRSMRADMGVMISASHNPYYDNGIKLFGRDGYKISDQVEQEIEAIISQYGEEIDTVLPEADLIGQASRLDDASGRYIEFVKGTFPRGMSLDNLRIVLDCANGAAYKVAPQALWELEADVIPIANTPNGVNINKECGATDTAYLQQCVLDQEADLGIALDGDADRLIVVDEKGRRIDGDQIMAVLAKALKDDNALQGGALVATVMSNLGLERYLKDHNINLLRTKVGDRYVVEAMREGGYNIGGEQSGHLVLSDFSTTGDGLLGAVQLLSILRMSGQRMSDLCKAFEPVPQILRNVKYEKGKKPLEHEDVKALLKTVEDELGDEGRVLVRASGTEPLIRVMAEGYDQDKVQSCVRRLCDAVKAVC
jgi:phosphoglucosamine mutase